MSSLNSIGQTIFELESGNGNFDGHAVKKQTNKQTDGNTPILKGNGNFD